MHRGGIDRSSDIFEMQGEGARGEVDLPHVANEGDVRVINRDGEIDLVFFCGDSGLLARGVFFFSSFFGLRTGGTGEISEERKKSKSRNGESGTNRFVEKQRHGLSPWAENPSMVRTADLEYLAAGIRLFHSVPVAGVVRSPFSIVIRSDSGIGSTFRFHGNQIFRRG